MNVSWLTKLLKGQTQNFLVQLVRYGMTGFVAFVVDYSILICLTELLSLHYLISAAIAFLCSVGVNYLLSIRWVFGSSRKDKPALVLSAFIVIGLIGLSLTEFLMWTFTELVGVHYLISKVVATFIVFFWNFSARRLFIEKKIKK